jgi:SAM-dependent methyltransferase
MHSIAARLHDDDYVLTRDATEYERLRAQARAWQAATSRLFDQVALGPGARCLDAGCGPGHTMRLMAERVGPSGHVTGVDIDSALGDEALALLLASGYGNCAFEQVDLEADGPIPGAPFDLVYARLLLFQEAGIGTSDGTDVAGRLESLRSGGWLYAEIYRSVLPLAVRLGLATRASYDQWSNAFARDSAQYPESALLWPLLIGTWKRKPAAQG